MKLAIADPPYPPFIGSGGRKNRASRWYGSGQRSKKDKPADSHERAGDWDNPETHRRLLLHLLESFDGFVIATSLDGIKAYGDLPPEMKICIWQRPNANPGAHRVRTTCEAVLLYPPAGRRSNRGGVGMVPDFLSAPVPRGGFTGKKPSEWVDWVLALMTWQEGDEVQDLFAGSGSVTDRIKELQSGGEAKK